MTHTISLPRK